MNIYIYGDCIVTHSDCVHKSSAAFVSIYLIHPNTWLTSGAPFRLVGYPLAFLITVRMPCMSGFSSHFLGMNPYQRVWKNHGS